MGAIALGLLALVLGIAVLRWFAGADPKALVKGLRWSGAGALLLVAIALAALDRVALAMLAGSMAYGLLTGGHIWPVGWPYPFGRRPGGAASGAGGMSTVKTEWLEMQLDHATGAMSGTILKGDFAGRSLDDLSPQELGVYLRLLAGVDSEGSRLLEAYIERRLGTDWRSREEFAPSRPGNMTRREAFSVLGLSEGASEDEIRAAHRRLILQTHPDRGGSSYLAAKINEAKDVLLGG